MSPWGDVALGAVVGAVTTWLVLWALRWALARDDLRAWYSEEHPWRPRPGASEPIDPSRCDWCGDHDDRLAPLWPGWWACPPCREAATTRDDPGAV